MLLDTFECNVVSNIFTYAVDLLVELSLACKVLQISGYTTLQAVWSLCLRREGTKKVT